MAAFEDFKLEEDNNSQRQRRCLQKRGMSADNDVFKIFFSRENKKRLQNKIKKEVFTRTRGKYKMSVDQKEQSLLAIMEGVYKNQVKYLDSKTIRQVKKLNMVVIDEIVPDMISSIKMHYKYLDDINQPLNPLPRAQSASTVGRTPIAPISSIYGF